jgi:hypothetical protein
MAVNCMIECLLPLHANGLAIGYYIMTGMYADVITCISFSK